MAHTSPRGQTKHVKDEYPSRKTRMRLALVAGLMVILTMILGLVLGERDGTLMPMGVTSTR